MRLLPLFAVKTKIAGGNPHLLTNRADLILKYWYAGKTFPAKPLVRSSAGKAGDRKKNVKDCFFETGEEIQNFGLRACLQSPYSAAISELNAAL